MKARLPLPRIRPEQILGFLLRHVEKFVVALFACFGLWLAWGGIAAARNESVTTGLRVDEVEKLAVAAERHIGAERQVPTDWLAPPAALAVAVDPWRLAQPVGPGPLSSLDRPLTGELAGRTKPEIFPLEDVRAVACLAVVRVKQTDQAATAAAPVAPAAAAPGPATGPAPAPRSVLGGKRRPNAPGAAETAPAAAAPAAPRELELKPFVVVTGLIPVEKQRDEYRLRYSQVRFRDPRRDAPWWCDFIVERLVVEPDRPEAWDPVDLADVRKLQDGWETVSDPVGPGWRLTPQDDGRSDKTTPIAFCGPLPPRVDQAWGPEAVHPWFIERLRAAGITAAATAVPPGGVPGGPADMTPPPPPVVAAPAQYAHFRFVDPTVELGKSYRYRVRLKVWNPNFNLPRQQLADVALAAQAKLASPDSTASAAVMVSNPLTMLVERLTKDDPRDPKPGMVEMLLLGESAKGGYALRGVATSPGGAVNVAEGAKIARGEAIKSPYLLVDVRGTGGAAEGKPADPLDALLLHEDGRYEVVSAADSQLVIDRHRATLPAPQPKESRGKAAEEPPPVGPNPFAPQGGSR